MIKDFIVNKHPELISYPDNVKYTKAPDSDILFDVLNRYYDNIYSFKPEVGFADISDKYHIIAHEENNTLIIDFTQYERKNIRAAVYKFNFGVNYYYFLKLVDGISLDKKLKDLYLDAYFTIVFRLFNKHLYMLKLDTIDMSLIYFALGRVFATKMIKYDYNDMIKRTRAVYKYFSPKITEIPEYLTFEDFVDILNAYNLTLSEITMSMFTEYTDKFLGKIGRSIIENPYYFSAYISATKFKSPVANTSAMKYNISVFNALKKFLLEQIRKV